MLLWKLLKQSLSYKESSHFEMESNDTGHFLSPQVKLSSDKLIVVNNCGSWIYCMSYLRATLAYIQLNGEEVNRRIVRTGVAERESKNQ